MSFLYAGTENGDVIGHICYAAKLILDDKAIWNEKTADGDTYLEHAKKYVSEDATRQWIVIWCRIWWIRRRSCTGRRRMSGSSGWGNRATKSMGKGIPWNQQMMLNNGFQRLAECHAILGDDDEAGGGV